MNGPEPSAAKGETILSEAKPDSASRLMRSVVPTEGNQPTAVPARSHETACIHCNGDATFTIWFGSGYSHAECCSYCNGTGLEMETA